YIQDPGPVLAASGVADLTAEMMRHLHQAVTNSKDRDSQSKNIWINLGRTVFVNAGRAARQNDPVGLFARNGFGRSIKADNLRINLQLTNASADDLDLLPSEIEDGNF